MRKPLVREQASKCPMNNLGLEGILVFVRACYVCTVRAAVCLVYDDERKYAVVVIVLGVIFLRSIETGYCHLLKALL